MIYLSIYLTIGSFVYTWAMFCYILKNMKGQNIQYENHTPIVLLKGMLTSMVVWPILIVIYLVMSNKKG